MNTTSLILFHSYHSHIQLIQLISIYTLVLHSLLLYHSCISLSHVTHSHHLVTSLTHITQSHHSLTSLTHITHTDRLSVSFWYFNHNDLAAQVSTLHVDMYDGSKWNTDVISPLQNISTEWQQYTHNTYTHLHTSRITVDLTGYLATATYMTVRLRVVETADYRSDIAVDDISFDFQMIQQSSTTQAAYVLSDSGMCVFYCV